MQRDRTQHGRISDVSAMHERKDLIRSVMESVCFSLWYCFGVLNEMKFSAKVCLSAAEEKAVLFGRDVSRKREIYYGNKEIQ